MLDRGRPDRGGGRLETVDSAGELSDVDLTAGPLAEAAELGRDHAHRRVPLRHARAQVGSKAPQLARAEVTVEVTARELAEPRVADDEAAGDRAGPARVAVGVERERDRVLTRESRVEELVSLVFGPTEVRAPSVACSQQVDLLPPGLANVADCDPPGVEGKPPRISEPIGKDLVAPLAVGD